MAGLKWASRGVKCFPNRLDHVGNPVLKEGASSDYVKLVLLQGSIVADGMCQLGGLLEHFGRLGFLHHGLTLSLGRFMADSQLS